MTSTDPVPAPRGGFAALRLLIGDLAAFAGRRGLATLGYIALGALFESAGLILLVPLLGLVMGSSGDGKLQRFAGTAFQASGAYTPVARLAVLMGGFVALMILRAVVISRRDKATQDLNTDFIEHMRARLLGRLAAAGWDQVVRLRHVRVLNALSADIQRAGLAAHYVLQATVAVVILAAQCVLSFLLAPGLALIAFALLIAAALALIPALRRARALGRFTLMANLNLVENAAQFLSGLKLAISQDLQKGFVAEYRETLAVLKLRQRSYNHQQIGWRVWLTTATAIVGAAVVMAGFALFHLQAPVLIAFLLVIGRMLGPATQLQQGFQLLANGLPAHESVVDLAAELETASPVPQNPLAALPEGPIVFEHVSFRHAAGEDGTAHGVRDLSLRIVPGTFLGIAGTSGAGKTTFADLLVGLTKPQAGRILVGDTVLDDTALPAWRAQLSYISQDPFLFHDTVRRNLAWVSPGASEREMWDALALTGADGIVKRMAGGLDAVVGERGSLVSGGERQRLALARALLRKPRLLVMDEATNAIDVDGEHALLARLLALRPRMTIVMIAHRAESIALCDRLLRMENGTLTEDSGGASAIQPAD